MDQVNINAAASPCRATINMCPDSPDTKLRDSGYNEHVGFTDICALGVFSRATSPVNLLEFDKREEEKKEGKSEAAVTTTPKGGTMKNVIREGSNNFYANDITAISNDPWPSTSLSASSERIDRLYKHGKEATRRRRADQGRTAVEQGCTFHPITNKTYKRRSKNVDEICAPQTRFDKLYESGKAIAFRREELAIRELARESAKHPFSPKINSEKKSQQRKDDDVTSNAGTGRKKSRFSALYDNAMEKQRTARAKAERVNDRECTFEPKLVPCNKHRPTKSNRTTERVGKDRLNDLHNHAKWLEEKRERLKNNLSTQHAFKPRINERSSKMVSPKGGITALCPEGADILKKQKRLDEIRHTREMQGCTFAPKVLERNESSNKVSIASQPCGNVHARLYHQYQNQRHKSSSEGHDFNNSDCMDISGEAIVPTARSQISTFSVVSEADLQRTFDRLYFDSKQHHAKKIMEDRFAQDRRKNHDWDVEHRECTFAPHIEEHSRKLATEARGGKEKATEVDTFERLFMDANDKVARREKYAMERTGLELNCTFQPEISCASKELVRKKFERERLLNLAHRHQAFIRKGSLSVRDAHLPTDYELHALDTTWANTGTSNLNRWSSFSSSPIAANAIYEEQKIGSEDNIKVCNNQEEEKLCCLLQEENTHKLMRIVQEDLANKEQITFREESWFVTP